MRLVPVVVLALAACSSNPPRTAAPTNEPLALDDTTPPPVETSAEPVTVGMRDGELALSRPVVYAANSDELTADSDAVIAAIAAYLRDKPAITTLRIEVHSDAQGNTAHNQALTERRALSTTRALVSSGVECARLLPVGFGETKPVADNRTAEGRAANRRTVFAPAALAGRLIGGMPADGGGAIAGDACAN